MCMHKEFPVYKYQYLCPRCKKNTFYYFSDYRNKELIISVDCFCKNIYCGVRHAIKYSLFLKEDEPILNISLFSVEGTEYYKNFNYLK